MKRLRGTVMAAALLTAHIPVALANPAPPADARSDDSVTALALQWFTRMRTGQIDRSQLAPAFGAQLTSAAVQEMSRYLKPYGAATGAVILRARTIGDQTFYDVKILLERGDSASLLIGLDSSSKVTVVSPVSMPGG